MGRQLQSRHGALLIRQFCFLSFFFVACNLSSRNTPVLVSATIYLSFPCFFLIYWPRTPCNSIWEACRQRFPSLIRDLYRVSNGKLLFIKCSLRSPNGEFLRCEPFFTFPVLWKGFANTHAKYPFWVVSEICEDPQQELSLPLPAAGDPLDKLHLLGSLPLVSKNPAANAPGIWYEWSRRPTVGTYRSLLRVSFPSEYLLEYPHPETRWWCYTMTNPADCIFPGNF